MQYRSIRQKIIITLWNCVQIQFWYMELLFKYAMGLL